MMISVVVPALNEASYLPQCLTSLQRQDYKGKFEVIVVDNNSTDDTARIAKKFKAAVVHCARIGVIPARQAGADAASGDIIVQADADTTYPANWLGRISRHFSSDPQTVAVGGNYSYREHFKFGMAEHIFRNSVNSASMLLYKRPFFVSGANFAFRRDAFIRIGGYSEGAFYPDQFDLAERLSHLGKVRHDCTLTVLTSSRRVEKPTILLLRDILVNFYIVLLHLFSVIFGKLAAFAKNVPKPVIRNSVRVSPLILLVGLLVYGYFIPTSEVFGKIYDEAKTSDKVIALTFDDGPNEPYTSEILEILKDYNVTATFFVIGKNVEEYPEVAKRIVSEGHILGDHSYAHKANHALTLQGCKDLKIAQESIMETVGLEPALYRPPHGKKSPWELHCVKEEGMAEITWTDSTNELNKYFFFGKPSAESIAKKIIRKAGPGKIIGLHDGYGTCHNCSRSDKTVIVDALPLIIEGLQKEGYRFVSIPELTGLPAYNN